METFLTSSKAKIIKLFEGKIETIYKKKEFLSFSACAHLFILQEVLYFLKVFFL